MAELSVVICTHKRYDLALNCLEFLGRQSLPRDKLEIVLIDNTPPDSREAFNWHELGVDRFAAEDQPGLSRARNAGIATSTSDLVAFIDDDAEAYPDWAENVVRTFATHTSALVVGGRVLAKYVGQDKPAWLSQRLEGYLSCIDWGTGVTPLRAGQWIVGANMTFRRRVFEEFGGFNASLGRIGHGTLLSNEETQLLGQLPPDSVYYAANATVDHLIPMERTLQPWFRKRVFWQAVSDQLSGFGASVTPDEYFERFASQLPTVPAEDRSFRALHRHCSTAPEFERQLDMLYALAMAEGLGLPDLRASGRFA